MARDDDEVDVEEAKDDDDRPRKKIARDDKDDRPVKEVKPMPVQLVGAIMAAFAWGFLSLYFSCVHTSTAIVQEIEIQKHQRDHEENLRKMRDQMKAAGAKFDFPGADRLETGNGLRYTMVGARFFMMLLSAILVAGASLLLARKGFAKFIAIGAPVGMLFVEFAAFVICLIISKGTFLTGYNVDFMINIVFSLVVGGCVAFLLFNKDVSKALK